MKRTKNVIWALSLSAAVLAAAVIILSFCCWDARPALLKTDPAVNKQVCALLDTVQDGGFSRCGGYFYGNPDLKNVFPKNDHLSELVSSALWDSLEYEIPGQCYADGSTLALDIRISAMDAASIVAQLEEVIPQTLQEHLKNTRSFEEVYDNDNHYRKEFMNAVTEDAFTQVREQIGTIEKTVTVHIGYDRGQWKILPEEPLIDALTGWITVKSSDSGERA